MSHTIYSKLINLKSYEFNAYGNSYDSSVGSGDGASFGDQIILEGEYYYNNFLEGEGFGYGDGECFRTKENIFPFELPSAMV